MAGFRLRGKEKSLCRRRPVCVFGTKAHASAVPPKLTASLPPALRRTIMRPPLGNGGISVVTTGPKAVRSALPGPFGRSLSPARTIRRLSVDNGGCLLLRVIGLCVWFSVWNEAIISALFPFVKLFFQLFSMNIFGGFSDEYSPGADKRDLVGKNELVDVRAVRAGLSRLHGSAPFLWDSPFYAPRGRAVPGAWESLCPTPAGYAPSPAEKRKSKRQTQPVCRLPVPPIRNLVRNLKGELNQCDDSTMILALFALQKPISISKVRL